MADFFSDLFNTVTGQEGVPQQTIIPTSDLLSQSYGLATAQAPNVIAYNQALAPGLMGVQLGVESQYDPNAAALRAATSRSILDQLNMGENLSPELQADITRRLLETGSATGFGISSAGMGNTIYETALQREARGIARRNEASGAVSRQRALNTLYNPNTGFAPQEIAGDIQRVQAAQDDYENLREDIRLSNFKNLISTATRLIGTGVGAAYGGAAGAQMGSEIGGNIFGAGSGVRGVKRQQSAGGGGLSGMMGGLFGGVRPNSVPAGEIPAGSDQAVAMGF